MTLIEQITYTIEKVEGILSLIEDNKKSSQVVVHKDKTCHTSNMDLNQAKRSFA